MCKKYLLFIKVNHANFCSNFNLNSVFAFIKVNPMLTFALILT
ncbi:hypothetical protein MtrunA17_Chr8g0378751 [Medicago truncatula]|uniref:Uncharacterized protein n=1 Tax=Medicago truncatula TaxID=3880 RepID=A0A396GNE0_MEDTR|nr:hypothetical protein MtrunA17_Chr8g0378751 [Medicago truncatula]